MIIWLASYPKSGNTWVRSFLASILYSNGENININDLNKLGGQYPLRSQFKNFVKDFNNIDEIKNEWINTQNFINLDNKTKFFKTHHVNCKIGSSSFTDLNNTLGVIYIVRDPRNMIASIANHYQHSIKESVDFLLDERKLLFVTNSNNPNYESEKNVVTLLGSWKDHYNSWKSLKKNLLIIKYEELISNSVKEFEKIRKYLEEKLNLKFGDSKFYRAIETNSFENLKKYEEKHGFKESIKDKNAGLNKKFFNLGPKNDWKNFLDKKIKLELEENFKKKWKN